MNIILNCGNASGNNYGMFAVSSKQKFTWKAGLEFAEKNLDDEIYRHNLKTKAYAKRLHKRCQALYQWVRAGPIVKCLRGPCMNPKQFDDGWFCAYRYKAKTSNTLMEFGGIDISTPSKPLPEFDMGEDSNPPIEDLI